MTEAVNGARGLLTDVAVAQVGEHEFTRPPPRIAVACAIGGVEADDVALVDFERGHQSIFLDFAIAANHLDVVGGALATAIEAPRLVLVARICTGEEAPV
jgi:hypothetical protein